MPPTNENRRLLLTGPHHPSSCPAGNRPGRPATGRPHWVSYVLAGARKHAADTHRCDTTSRRPDGSWSLPTSAPRSKASQQIWPVPGSSAVSCNRSRSDYSSAPRRLQTALPRLPSCVASERWSLMDELQPSADFSFPGRETQDGFDLLGASNKTAGGALAELSQRLVSVMALISDRLKLVKAANGPPAISERQRAAGGLAPGPH